MIAVGDRVWFLTSGFNARFMPCEVVEAKAAFIRVRQLGGADVIHVYTWRARKGLWQKQYERDSHPIVTELPDGANTYPERADAPVQCEAHVGPPGGRRRCGLMSTPGTTYCRLHADPVNR